MSLTRNILNEFRPFFRLFDETSRMRSSYPVLNRHFDRHFDDFGFPSSYRPSIDLSEQGKEYVVAAELPGVKKENIEVRVGDNGRSLTIEGRVHSRSTPYDYSSPITADKDGAPAAQDTSQDVVQTHTTTQIMSEREFVSNSHFTRTIWLPRPVDGFKVTGSLEDGILTLCIPKAAEQGSVKVEIQ